MFITIIVIWKSSAEAFGGFSTVEKSYQSTLSPFPSTSNSSFYGFCSINANTNMANISLIIFWKFLGENYFFSIKAKLCAVLLERPAKRAWSSGNYSTPLALACPKVAHNSCITPGSTLFHHGRCDINWMDSEHQQFSYTSNNNKKSNTRPIFCLWSWIPELLQHCFSVQ